MAGFRTDLLTGLGRHLAIAGVATWRDDGAYTTGQTGITIGAVPNTPDRLITLTGYDVANDPTLSTDVTGVQLRTRWAGQDPRPADDLADRVFDLWHGAGPLILPTGVRLQLLLRMSSTSLGQDGNGRWSRADNYYVTAWRPSPNRT